jgi:hypothetical protein
VSRLLREVAVGAALIVGCLVVAVLLIVALGACLPVQVPV